MAEISQLLWSAQGITGMRGFRTPPSAGALYPLELYVIVGNVKNLLAAIYKYTPRDHALLEIVSGDRRSHLSRAALRQGSIRKAPVVILFCAVYERMTGKYGQRGIGYVHMEVGHAAQNVCLQAIALGLQYYGKVLLHVLLIAAIFMGYYLASMVLFLMTCGIGLLLLPFIFGGLFFTTQCHLIAQAYKTSQESHDT